MADSPESTVEPQDRDEYAGLERRTLLKPPNKRKYEEEMEAIAASIKPLEDERAKLQAGSSPDHIREQLRVIRAYKDDLFNKRKNIDADLQKINLNMGKQNSELTKVESTLIYKSEDRTNQTINRLEQQLKMRNFTLREERRIVNEIDGLKRSKKALVHYMITKKMVDTMKDQARKMREERERYQKEFTAQKQKEEKIKQQAYTDKHRCEQIKKDLDELYNRKRTITAEFRVQAKEYQQMMRHKHDEVNRKKKEEKLQKQEEYQQELAEYEAMRCPYQDEIQLCATLITYVQRYVTEPEQSTDKSQTDKSPEPTLESPRQDLEGMYVLKKKIDEELFGGVVRPKSRNNKRAKRRTLSNKPIYHSPEIFEQFSTLKLSAPSNTGEVLHALQQLETTKKRYEELSKAEESVTETGNWDAVDYYLQSLPNSGSLVSPSDGQNKLYTSLAQVHLPNKPRDKVATTSSESTSSKVEVSSIGPESAICEDSIPSTPEVQQDNQPPRFLPASPTLSQDSGTVSLDNGQENSKRATSPTTSDHSTLVPDESPSSRSDSIEDARTDSLEPEPSLDVLDPSHCEDKDLCDTEQSCGDAAASAAVTNSIDVTSDHQMAVTDSVNKLVDS